MVTPSPIYTGFYVLWLELPSPRQIVIGKLGRFDFPAGVYLYIGSALGPGGLQARLRRHLRKEKKRHWHIDYLRAECEVRGMIACPQSPGCSSPQDGKLSLECRWSQALAGLPGAKTPAPGFGSSDCRSGCRTHLVYLPIRGDRMVSR